MTDAFTKFVPSFDAVVEFHKANFEAFVQAQTAFAKGVQEISKEMVAQAQAHLEAAVATGKSAFAAKTFKDVVEVNVDGAKVSYEKFVAGTTKLSELGVQISNDAFAPIKARATVATEALLKPLAA
ncbi:MAG TPA: phasin family protein [Stellaceae bacterium]|nr:phasin family protein [Stellaceae bacterium]